MCSLGSLQETLNTCMAQPTDHSSFWGCYHQAIAHNPVKQGKSHPGSTPAGRPTRPALPTCKGKVQDTPVGSVCPGLGEATSYLCPDKNQTGCPRSLSPKARGAIIRGLFLKRIKTQEATCKPQSLLDLAGQAWHQPRILQGAAQGIPCPAPTPESPRTPFNSSTVSTLPEIAGD